MSILLAWKELAHAMAELRQGNIVESGCWNLHRTSEAKNDHNRCALRRGVDERQVGIQVAHSQPRIMALHQVHHAITPAKLL